MNEVPYVCIMAKVRTMDLWKICTCFRPRLGALLLVVVRCCGTVTGGFILVSSALEEEIGLHIIT